MLDKITKVLEQKKSKKYSAKTIVDAIEQVESSGGVNTMGKSGEKGALQFMPTTWKEYSAAYLKAQGKSGILPQTYANQRRVAEFKIQNWMDQGFDIEQLAAAWNTGAKNAVTGAWKKMVGVNEYGAKFDTPSYVNKVLGVLGTNNTTENTPKVETKEWKNPMENIPVIGKPISFLGNLGAGIIHGTARSAATFAMEYKNALAKELGIGRVSEELPLAEKGTPSGVIDRILFGEGPFQTIAPQGKDFQKTLEYLGVDKSISEKISTPLVSLFVALDFTGFGGEKALLKQMVKTGILDDAIKMLTKLKIPEEIITEYAPKIVKVANEIDAEKLLNSIKKSTKVFNDAAKQVDTLIKEASKYKSAEEFVKNIDYEVLNPEQIKTKSQLTDIWNKANQVSKAAKDIGMDVATGAKKVSSIVKMPDNVIDNGATKFIDNGAEIFMDSKINQELAIDAERELAEKTVGQLDGMVDDIMQASRKIGDKLVEGNIPALSSKALDALPQGIKTSVKKTIILSSKLKGILNQSKSKVEDALYQIMGELEISEAGKRIFINEGQIGGVKTIVQKSTFPSWVPSELRHKKLFNKTMKYLTDIDAFAFPANASKNQLRLLEVIYGKIDKMTGLNTQGARKELFNEIKSGGFKNIKQAIKKNEQIKKQMLAQLNKISRQANENLGRKFDKEPFIKYDKVDDIYKSGKEINTKRIKHTKEYAEVSDYVSSSEIEKNVAEFDKLPKYGTGLGKIIKKLETMMGQTPNRVAEGIDGGIGGFFTKKVIKPVQEAETRMNRFLRVITGEIKEFKILEGSTDDVAASLYAQKQWNKPISQNAKKFAEYARRQYDDLINRMNAIRLKLGLPLIKKRADYVTHTNELVVVGGMGMFDNGMEKRLNAVIEKLKATHVDDPTWTKSRLRSAAIRKIEQQIGAHGELARYVDPQNIKEFKFLKERLAELEKNPSLIASLDAYMKLSTQYIYQAENFVKNKAFIDALTPGNAKSFLQKWNRESVGGFTPILFLDKDNIAWVNRLRNQIGSNMMLGSFGTMALQTTSVAQVIAHAGLKNTAIGYAKRIASYLNDKDSYYVISETKAGRDVGLDIGHGQDFLDDILKKIGEISGAKNGTAKLRAANKFGKDLWGAVLKEFDQLTVGATWETFYRQGVVDKGYDIVKAMEYADELTGKTQATYLKTALPLIYNIAEGRVAGQFGIYAMNQFQSLLHDTGKVFDVGEKSVRSKRTAAQQLFKFMVAAYAIDMVSNKAMGRSPYEVKPMADSIYGAMTGDSSWEEAGTTTKDSFANYVPFLSSAKYGSLPPVAEFGKDLYTALWGSGDAQEKSFSNLGNKWALLLSFPFGGNQFKKTMEGMEAAYGIDVPGFEDKSETKAGKEKYDFDNNWEKIKAVLFGPSATEGAQEYYHELDFPEKKTKTIDSVLKRKSKTRSKTRTKKRKTRTKR